MSDSAQKLPFRFQIGDLVYAPRLKWVLLVLRQMDARGPGRHFLMKRLPKGDVLKYPETQLIEMLESGWKLQKRKSRDSN